MIGIWSGNDKTPNDKNSRHLRELGYLVKALNFYITFASIHLKNISCIYFFCSFCQYTNKSVS